MSAKMELDLSLVCTIPSNDIDGLDLTATDIRAAFQKRLDGLSDEELLEAVLPPDVTRWSKVPR